MSGGHAHALFHHGHGPLHRLGPEAKLAATLGFVIAVVATPREAFWAFGAHAALLVGVALVGRIPLGFVVRRMLVEVPFVVFAVLLPLVGQGARTEVIGLSLSVEGLWGAWNILAKGTLGVGATVVMAASTPVAEIIHGLERLRAPRLLTTIATLMIRYLEVITDELARMRIARIARGHDPRWLWQAGAVASSAGALFIRSYERGERVHDAMLSRGFVGVMPVTRPQAPRRDWLVTSVVPALALATALVAWLIR